jgi:hypothetical protein
VELAVVEMVKEVEMYQLQEQLTLEAVAVEQKIMFQHQEIMLVVQVSWSLEQMQVKELHYQQLLAE